MSFPRVEPSKYTPLGQRNTPRKMNTRSHTPKGDNMEEAQNIVKERISQFEAKQKQDFEEVHVILDKMENKLTNKIEILEETLKAILKPKGNGIQKQHRRMPHEEFSDSILSHKQQPPFYHGHKLNG